MSKETATSDKRQATGKFKADPRFIQSSGNQVYTGAELLLKGALEAGCAYMTGYPGSPLAEFFNVAQDQSGLLKELGIVFQLANNEALSAARLAGSQMADLRAMTVIKSVGAHVASDGLALGNLSKTGTKGGALAVIGDDPWSDSTQVPTDSRFLAKHLHMPVMEPSNFQELKDWMDTGFELSKLSDLFVTYLVTTNLADGGGSVRVHPNRPPAHSRLKPFALDTATIPVEETVILSPRTAEREETLEGRYQILLKEARRFSVNEIRYPATKAKIGFISSGLAYWYLEHALSMLGLLGKFPILKLGITFPVDEKILLEFVETVGELFVVEEKRDFLESQVGMLLKNAFQQGRLKRFVPVWGKTFPSALEGFPKTKGLNSSVLLEKLIPVLRQINDPAFDRVRMDEEMTVLEQTAAFQMDLPVRTPTFCPGCPHRDSSSVLLDVKKSFNDEGYMRKTHDRDKTDLVFHGDTGCYTMLMFEPNKELMHNYSGMGLGGGTGAGIDPFITNKQVVFMGDSTFFHSGMIAISDALKHSQDITFIILENGTTAMTGHQPTPANPWDVCGTRTISQSIEEVIRGMIRGQEITLERVNPAYRENYRKLLEETILKEGVKVIIADKECGITFQRRTAQQEHQILKAKRFLPRKQSINITPEVCEFCLECTRSTGCPGLTFVDTPYGPKVQTDLTWCVGDSACTKGKVCPSFEEIVVTRERPPRQAAQVILREDLPEIQPRRFHCDWQVYIAGVGGMGIGVITAILVRAGLKEGHHVLFCDKKGLAIRNGGVYSHVTYTLGEDPHAPVIPYGKADLLLAIDFLEGVRGLDPHMNMRVGHPRRTAAIVNTAKTPTIRTLMGEDDLDIRELEKKVKTYTRPEAYVGVNVSEVSQRLLGDKLYVNLMMLGIAYQRGELPLRRETLEWAIEASVKRDKREENLRAFHIGRELAVRPEAFESEERSPSYEDRLRGKRHRLSKTSEFLAETYERMVEEAVKDMRLDDQAHEALALRVYDLIRYENLVYAQRYLDLVRYIFGKDQIRYGYEATKAVISYLHKVMLIKDEIYVSYLLTSDEKLERDRRRYNIDPENGDRIRYRHFNRPEFALLGKDIQFDLTTYNWQLRLMRRMKFLRRLLPQWHRREKAFREWYIRLVQDFTYQDKESYQRYIEALSAPEIVRGYRQIRYPKMEEARQLVESLLHPKRQLFATGQAPRL